MNIQTLPDFLVICFPLYYESPALPTEEKYIIIIIIIIAKTGLRHF